MNNSTLLDEIFGGWQSAGTLVLQSGQPFTVTMKTNSSYSQAGQWYPNLIGNPHLSHGAQHGTNQWFNEAAFAQPTPGTFGNSGRNTLNGPPLKNVNFSLGKTFAIWEQVHLQIRADANNVFNHPSFGLPTTGTPSVAPLTVCSAAGTTGCSAAGATQTGTSTIRSTTVGGRTMQLGARLSF